MNTSREVQRYRRSLTSKYDGTKNRRLIFIEGLVIVALLLFVVFRFIIGTSTVDGNSMDPTLKNGQRLFFFRAMATYDIGDIISMRTAGGDYYVKRIVAKEGDVVSISEGRLYVNGEEPDEPFAAGETQPQENTVIYPYTVGKDAYFVLGDNRENSVDSRSFGAVVKYQIRGKILGDYD